MQISLFDLVGMTAEQELWVRSAISRCTFDWSLLLPGLQQLTGRSTIDVRFQSLNGAAGGRAVRGRRHELETFTFGMAFTDGRILLDTTLDENETAATFMAEGAHMVDFFYLTDAMRMEIAEAYAIANEVPVGEDIWWWVPDREVNDRYYEQAGESFMNGFALAFSTVPMWDWEYKLRTTPTVITRIREVLKAPPVTMLSFRDKVRLLADGEGCSHTAGWRERCGSEGVKSAAKLLKHVAQNGSGQKVFKTKEEFRATVDALDGHLADSGFVKTEDKKIAASTLLRAYVKGDITVRVNTRGRLIEQNPNMPSLKNNVTEYVVHVVSEGKLSLSQDEVAPSFVAEVEQVAAQMAAEREAQAEAARVKAEAAAQVQAAALTALEKYATVQGGAEARPSVRAADLFGMPSASFQLPMNRKTTANAVEVVPLDRLEPSQDTVSKAGLAAYIVKPRRDPPDVARLTTRDGRVRLVVHEGHTRLGAAKLRGEPMMEARVWDYMQTASGDYEPVPRGLHARGLRTLSSYREKLLALCGEMDAEEHTPLTAADLDIPALNDWQILREGLSRRFEFKNRRECAAFAAQLLQWANVVNHHPDVVVANNAVTLTYVTHAAGDQITALDVEGAREANTLADDVRLLNLTDDSVLNLPDIADVAFPTVIGAVNPKPPKPKKPKRPVKYQGVLLGRAPTAFEAHVLSLSDIPRRYDADVDKVVETIVAARLQHARAVLETRGAKDAVDEAARQQVRRQLSLAQHRIGRYGAFELRRECQRQYLNVDAPHEHSRQFDAVERWMSFDRGLSEGLDVAARSLRDEWVATLERSRLRARRARKTQAALDLVEPHAPWGVKAVVSRILHEGFAASRGYEMKRLRQRMRRTDVHLKTVDDDEAEEKVDYVIQSAVMDKNTCDPCGEADGLTFEYDDDDMIEHQPPYFRCLGGDLCRCVQIYVLKNGESWIVGPGEQIL
jgi:4a-hydroxytetrahydrobiopterin dehydratase